MYHSLHSNLRFHSRPGDPNRYLPEVIPFETTESYLLHYPECCRLANPAEALNYFQTLDPIDSIADINAEMWDVFTDVGIWEWYRIRLPNDSIPWGRLCLPNDLTLLFLLDKQRSRALSVDINERYLNNSVECSLFAGYGMSIPNDIKHERNLMEFLARQTNHFENDDDYVLVTHRN